MTEKEDRQQEVKLASKAISAATIKLIFRYPLFGHTALRLTMIPTYDITTTMIDNRLNMYYNPSWINALDPVDQVSSVAHEIGHLIQGVFTRTPKVVVPMVWNRAADYMVDTMTQEAGIEPGPWRRQKCPPEMMEKANELKTTESMYRWLLQEQGSYSCDACAEIIRRAMNGEIRNCGGQSEEKGEEGGEGEGGGELPEHTCGHGPDCCTASTLSQNNLPKHKQIELQSKITQIVMHAAITQQKKGKGSLPGQLEEFLASLSKPKVRWKDKIRLTATSVFRDRYSFNLRSRRSYAMGLILPGRTKAPQGAIISLDTSGSMSDNQISRCLSEVVGIMVQCGCPEVTVLLHDCEVYHEEKYNMSTITSIRVQRGGTSHVPVFERLNDRKRREKPALVICFTDLMTSFPEERPMYPVLWCCPKEYKDKPVPWGKKIPIDMEDI